MIWLIWTVVRRTPNSGEPASDRWADVWQEQGSRRMAEDGNTRRGPWYALLMSRAARNKKAKRKLNTDLDLLSGWSRCVKSRWERETCALRFWTGIRQCAEIFLNSAKVRTIKESGDVLAGTTLSLFTVPRRLYCAGPTSSPCTSHRRYSINPFRSISNSFISESF